MCDTCGCGQPADAVIYRKPGQAAGHDPHHEHAHGHPHHEHDHRHDQDHAHPHEHAHNHTHDHIHDSTGRLITVEQDVLSHNNLLAQRNRGWFEGKGVVALNLVSSPGSGKTTLLEKTIVALQGEVEIAVIEGDQQTLTDADRIAATGADVVQVNTGQGCHLDAQMIRRACEDLTLEAGSLLMIENVGNLVCPALFDLGEQAKIVIISVTEGDDKPLKYPTMFAASDLCLINKIDLLPHVEFDVARCEEAARSVNPRLEFLHISATQGDGLETWIAWLRENLRQREVRP